MSHFFNSPRVLATFNAPGDGVADGGVTHVDENATQTSVIQPWVAQYDGIFKRATHSAATTFGSPTYDLNIFVNAVLEDTLAITIAEKQAIFSISIPFVKGDLVSTTLVNTHGTPASNNFLNRFIELWG